jgi:hypothetical protein
VRLDLPPVQHDPERVRQAADDILAQRRYQWDDPPSDPLEAIAEWIADRLGGAASTVGLGGGALPAVAGYVVLALLVGLVVFLVWRSRAGLRPRPKLGVARADVVVAAGEDDRDWAAEAAAHEAAGRWRDALRCRYRVLVGELADRGVIADLADRTAGEYVGEVRSTCPPAGPAFAVATDLFEQAWYGGVATGPGERDRFARLAGDVLAVAVAVTTAPGAGGGSGGRPDRPVAVPT